ncbi:hypothetical protein NL676_026800 [Syzygium grande]|nr:hypothetical protein NL676_026800 [Syzygium grande]
MFGILKMRLKHATKGHNFAVVSAAAVSPSLVIFGATRFVLLSSLLAAKMSRPGDWNCKSCQHLNFQRRDTCQRCGDVRCSSDFASFGGRSGSSFGFTGSDVRPGDCAAQIRKTWLAAMISTCRALEVQAMAVAAGPDGNRAIGSALGSDAMSTTSPAEWNVSGAMPLGTTRPTDLTRSCKVLFNFGRCGHQERRGTGASTFAFGRFL